MISISFVYFAILYIVFMAFVILVSSLAVDMLFDLWRNKWKSLSRKKE